MYQNLGVFKKSLIKLDLIAYARKLNFVVLNAYIKKSLNKIWIWTRFGSGVFFSNNLTTPWLKKIKKIVI